MLSKHLSTATIRKNAKLKKLKQFKQIILFCYYNKQVTSVIVLSSKRDYGQQHVDIIWR